MAAGRRGALSAVVVMVAALAPLLLAGVVRADCFAYCFKDCISKDKSMTDYCNYACDKTCDPGAPQRPLAATGSDIGCQLSCAKTSCDRLVPDRKAVETCFGTCYDGCMTKPLPRPLRAGSGAASGPIFPSSEPDRDDAATEKHPFHEKQDGVRPSSEPNKDAGVFHEKQDGVRPSSEPDKDDAVRPWSEPPGPDRVGRPGKGFSSLNCNFHEKQDCVQPASEPRLSPFSEIHAPPAPL